MSIPIVYGSFHKKNIKVNIEIPEWRRFIDYDINHR